jgi:hypothetical protein
MCCLSNFGFHSPHPYAPNFRYGPRSSPALSQASYLIRSASKLDLRRCSCKDVRHLFIRLGQGRHHPHQKHPSQTCSIYQTGSSH